MPYSARKQGKGKWAVVNKRTGKVVGHSSTKHNAQASARARNAAAHGWHPTKRR